MSNDKTIKSALISVFSKDGLAPIVKELNKQGVTLYSTGGTEKFIKDLGIEVIERSVDKTELFIADEVFLSGTAAKITPVKQVETYKLSSNRPITDKLKAKLTAITANQDKDYQDWVYTVDL